MKFEKHIIQKPLRLFLIGLCFCILKISAIGQTKNKNYVDIQIYGGQNGNLYTNGSNLISIVTKDTSAEFSIKSSQGVIRQLAKYMFFVDSLQKGKAIITILKSKKGELIPLRKKEYNVFVPRLVTKYNSLTISPEISIGGRISGKIKLDTLKKIRALTINDNYSITNATFYIGVADHMSTTIKSKYFDEQLIEIWQRMGPNCVVSIDNIEFVDKKGDRYTYPTTISVIAIE